MDQIPTPLVSTCACTVHTRGVTLTTTTEWNASWAMFNAQSLISIPSHPFCLSIIVMYKKPNFILRLALGTILLHVATTTTASIPSHARMKVAFDMKGDQSAQTRLGGDLAALAAAATTETPISIRPMWEVKSFCDED